MLDPVYYQRVLAERAADNGAKDRAA